MVEVAELGKWMSCWSGGVVEVADWLSGRMVEVAEWLKQMEC